MAGAAHGVEPDESLLIDGLFPRLSTGMRWGLSRVAGLLAAAGDPQRRFATVHVGGTNGKGTVVAAMEAVLRRSGLRTGMFTTPHLHSPRECIRINGVPATREQLARAAASLTGHDPADPPTRFEALTAVAFAVFAAQRVDIALVEVGLGGDDDATNVVEPALVVLTGVERDHTRYLGDTLEAIARRKAGIIKPGVPVLSAARDPGVRAVLRDRCTAMEAPLHLLEPDEVRDVEVSSRGTAAVVRTRRWGELRFHSSLVGVQQPLNLALAVRALELLPDPLRPAPETVLDGLRQVALPGRMQIEQRDGFTWILDVAHNPPAVRALEATLARVDPPRPLVAVVGILRDKEWHDMVPVLARVADRVILTALPGAPPDRVWDPEAVRRALPLPTAEVAPDVGSAIAAARRALADSPGGGGTVLVTGSFFTVADALSYLGVPVR